MNYGLPYQGSKNKIAKDLINTLPSGKRFVDLFGGGFAMSHCALLSGKYKQVFYNEINPLLPVLIRKAMNGDYNYDKFKPEFVDREKFFAEKEKDGYIKYIWSFSNEGKTYLFGKHIEKQKQSLHNYVLFGIKDNFITENFPDIDNVIQSADITQRRLGLKRIIKNACCEQLERLQRLQQLQQLDVIGGCDLALNQGDYKDYQYQLGDIVYCDPPYKNTNQYDNKQFDFNEFLEWVATRPYQVFFSSYDDINDNRFEIIWQKPKQVLMNGARTTLYRNECLYTNIKENI